MRKYDILVVLVILLLVSACTTQEVKEPTVIPATETQTPWPSTTVTSTPEPTEVFTPTATFTPTPLPYEGSYDVYPEAKLVIGNEGNIVFGNYSPQGKYFAAALDCGEVHLFELPDYKVTSKFKLRTYPKIKLRTI